MSSPKHGYITQEQANTHEAMSPLLQSMYLEFQELSKKKPGDVLSISKVRLVNRLLSNVLKLLENDPVRPFLNDFDEDDLPQNSDVILMLGQVKAAMIGFKTRYYDSRFGWYVKT